MGQILIAPAARSDYVDAHVARITDVGFQKDVDETISGWRVLLHRPLNGTPVHLFRADDGGFAAHSGAFFFRHLTGEAALEAFHAAFDPANPPWSECRGHFALTIVKNETLHLMTDGFGSHHIHHDTDLSLFSSSFVAVAESIAVPSADIAGVYEYAWNGSTFGSKTVLEQVKLLPAPALVSFAGDATVRTFPSPVHMSDPQPASTFDEAVNHHVGRLRELFGTYATLAPRPFRTALSGGFDSRLILAGLLDAGIQPELFVFGPGDDPDVRCGIAIAEGEGLSIRHIDKAGYQTPMPAAVKQRMERDFYAFDALKNDGLFDNGADFADRMSRQDGGTIVLNGSVGEIYRNFFYLPDRSLSLRHLVRSFFSRYDPAAMTPAFSTAAYETQLVEDMQTALNTNEPRTDRASIEALYPLFRGRYWSARDTSVNQRFGWMVYPFLEPALVKGTPSLPMHWKQFGRLEAAMIARLSPRLAAYDSSYGGPFDRPLPLSCRMKVMSTVLRPAWLRQHSYRWQRHGPPEPILSDSNIKDVIDSEMPYARRWFQLERLRDPQVLNRVLTLEYLFERLGAA